MSGVLFVLGMLQESGFLRQHSPHSDLSMTEEIVRRVSLAFKAILAIFKSSVSCAERTAFPISLMRSA